SHCLNLPTPHRKLVHQAPIVLRPVRLRHLGQPAALPMHLESKISQKQVDVRHCIEHKVRKPRSVSGRIPPPAEPRVKEGLGADIAARLGLCVLGSGSSGTSSGRSVTFLPRLAFSFSSAFSSSSSSFFVFFFFLLRYGMSKRWWDRASGKAVVEVGSDPD